MPKVVMRKDKYNFRFRLYEAIQRTINDLLYDTDHTDDVV